MDPAVLASMPVVPWEYRRALGWITAYWKTVWLVLRTNGRLNVCLLGPVSFRDAKMFCNFGIAQLMVVAIAGSAATWFDRPLITLAVLAGTIPMAFGLRILAGIISWFFCPKFYPIEIQNRCIALSYYTSAPLSMSLAILLPICLGNLLSKGSGAPIEVVLIPAGVLIIYWYQLALSAARSLVRRSRRTVAIMAVTVPLLWAAVPALIAGVLLAAAVLLGMWASLT